MNVAKMLRNFLGILDKFWKKLIGNLKQIANTIFGIFGKIFEKTSDYLLVRFNSILR